MKWVWALLCISLSLSCNTRRVIAWTETVEEYEPVEADFPFAGVYQSLDGTWEGGFYVYRDTLGQRESPVKPRYLSDSLFNSLPLKLEQVLEVEQVYASENPYYQRVTIYDTYPTEEGSMATIISTGANKVEAGQLWCVVNKPEEQVRHLGSRRGENTLLWERDLRKPLKIEFFQETVEEDSYLILGWGYYGDDDPELSPLTWFRGEYVRKK